MWGATFSAIILSSVSESGSVLFEVVRVGWLTQPSFCEPFTLGRSSIEVISVYRILPWAPRI
jgi:hypothetical protein